MGFINTWRLIYDDINERTEVLLKGDFYISIDTTIANANVEFHSLGADRIIIKDGNILFDDPADGITFGDSSFQNSAGVGSAGSVSNANDVIIQTTDDTKNIQFLVDSDLKFLINDTQIKVYVEESIYYIIGDTVYPAFAQYTLDHDDISLNFDAYWDGANWKSSDIGSNAQIVKQTDILNINHESGIAQGSNITWDNAVNINLTTGKVGLKTGTSINEFSIDGTLAGDSDDAIPTEKAVKTYIDNAVPPIKEKFLAGTDYNGNFGNYRIRSIAGTGTQRFTCKIPSDFNNLVSIDLMGIVAAGAAGAGKDIDLTSDYAAEGEVYNFHTETDTATVYDFTGTTDEVTAVLDLSIVLASITANDFVGVFVDHNGIGGTIYYLGIRLRYT